jgi:hypothetical protein
MRAIAWRHWDPLSRNGADERYRPDAYDSYVARVVRGLCCGETEASLVNYLVSVEAYHLGIPLTYDSRVRAQTTVAAVSDYLNRLQVTLDEAA